MILKKNVLLFRIPIKIKYYVKTFLDDMPL